jgi:hypothetical protein
MTPAGRYLAAVFRLLPAPRRHWGEAMQAELAAIEHPAERWRFALSCTRVALMPMPRAARFARSGQGAGALAGLVAGVAAFLVLPFERIGEPLASGLPGRGTWLAVVVFAALAAAGLVTGLRTGEADQAVMAMLWAGALAALVVAVLGLAAISLFPDSVPNIVGPVMPPGTPLAVQHSANATEASDPYDGLLAFSLMLFGLLWATVRPSTRPGVTIAALCLLALPPLALAGTARDFPGSNLIATATLAVVIGAVCTTRPGDVRVSPGR